jgi:MFS family permease
VRRVLQLPAYRRLLAAYTLNELAWSIGSLALAYLVYRRTGSAIGATAFFLCSQFVPSFIAPSAVARLDRAPPRSVLPALYALEALAFLALAWFATHFALVPVLVLTLVDGIFALTARSLARATTYAATAPAGLLREANAVTNTFFSVCFMAGPAIGGAVVAVGGATPALIANAGLFAVMALTLTTASGLPEPETERDRKGSRVRAALVHVRKQPMVAALMSVQAAALVFFTLSIPVEVVFVQHTLHAGADGYGAMLSTWGCGAIAGSAVFARWRLRAAHELIALGAAGLGIGFLIIAAAPNLPMALVGSVVAGIGNGIVSVALRTALQEAVEESWMAIMMGLNESLSQALPGVGILLGGAIAALASPRAAFVVGGVGSLLITVAAWTVLRPAHVRRRPQMTSPHAPPQH